MRWADVRERSGLFNVSESLFLRRCQAGPASVVAARGRALARAVERAARERTIFHLWWHPHDFGEEPELNLQFLKRNVLQTYARCSEDYGLRSLSMGMVADELASSAGGSPRPIPVE